MSPEIVCGIIVAVALLKGLAIGWFAGVQRGLYLGEKGRRQAAESMLVLGVPEQQPAGRVAMKNAPLLEPKMAPQGWDQKTLAKGAQALKGEAKSAGVALSDDQALAMAGDMLQMSMLGGAEDDIAVG